jgi:uncharacterized protein YndB with AHSA1/START domain
MSTGTVSLHRVFPAPPEKVFRAFTDPAAQAAWLPPYGFLCTVQSFEPKVGGTYKMTFINFSTGNKHSFGGTFQEIRTNEFLKYTDRFDDPNLPGEMITTVSFKKVSVGTEVHVKQEGIPSAIPEDGCYLGWQDSLDKLMRLVSPNIPDA